MDEPGKSVKAFGEPDIRILHSYLRFSTPEQALGHSERRQVDRLGEWTLARGAVFDENYRDPGVSGFHVGHVAALGTGVSVILPSLMIGIDQRIVAERRKTFGEVINGVLLYGSEHFGVPIALVSIG